MEITNAQKKKIKKIGENNNLMLAMIFGSRAKGNSKEDSDLDIAFMFKKEADKKYKYYYGGLFKDLSEIFKGYNVDLVDLKNTDFIFRYELFLNSRLIFGNPLNYYEFKARAFREYMDNSDLLRLYDILAKKKNKLLKQKIYAKI